MSFFPEVEAPMLCRRLFVAHVQGCRVCTRAALAERDDQRCPVGDALEVESRSIIEWVDDADARGPCLQQAWRAFELHRRRECPIHCQAVDPDSLLAGRASLCQHGLELFERASEAMRQIVMRAVA